MSAHQPPLPAQMVLLLGGFRISQALYAAAVLGVGDQLLAGPEPVEVLAERSGAHAPRILAGHGVDDRVDCVGGDFFESVPPGADAYLASLVLHDWPDQQAQRILANIAEAGGSGARLLVLDFVVPPGDAPHMSKISDLNMLAMMGGKERTGTEWRELLTDAGFTGIGIRQTDTPFSVIQATVQ